MSSTGEFSLRPSEASGDKIVIVVGGVKHEIYKSTLMKLPGSRLARLIDTETPPSEVFYDRHPEVFTHVLQYYRSGRLHCPTNLCGPLLEEEFAFWGISSSDVEPCCWAAFRKHRDAVDALAQIDPSVMEKEENSGQEDKSSNSRPWQWKLWALFDDPQSSDAAEGIAIISLLFVLLSIIAFSLETHRKINPLVPDTHLETSAANTSVQKNWESVLSGRYSGVLDAIELVCLIWFMTEFLIRVFSCPSKCRFFMNLLNIVDLLALFPWFLRWCSGEHCVGLLGFLHVMRCLRFLRVFRLMQHVLGVRVLGYALRTSATALCVVPLLLFSCTIIFGTMAYYAEVLGDGAEHKDLPSSFWWAVVTLTTVGYGDMLPITAQGQIVAILCAAVGVLLIVLPVPIIVYNFIMFYSLTKAKYSMLSKKEKSKVDTGPSASKTPA